MDERVLVIDASELKKINGLEGISTSDADILRLHYDCTKNAVFVSRKRAEVDESIKQVIPYIVIRRGKKILAYMRSKQSGEGRLHNKWSVGVGGHINPKDDIKVGGFSSILSMAISRELTEELEWDDLFDYTVTNINKFGIIYDSETDVGRVHVGIVFIVDLPERNMDFPKPKEDTMSKSEWYPAEEAVKLPNLESWSKFVLEAMTA